MTDARPDPDQLLNRLKQEEVYARRGKLKIFFGASAGVGKTYAMLLAARRLRGEGREGSIVTILCDGGERYATSYYCEAWLAEQGYELAPLIDRVAACVEQGGALPDIPRSGL